MKPPNHTPGPWTVSRAAQADPFAIEAAARTVAHVRHAATVAETRANAKVLAAVPDLLEALEDIAHGRMPEADLSDGFHSRFMSWAQSRARDAIARAEGDSK